MKVTICFALLFALFATVMGYPDREVIDEVRTLMKGFAYAKTKRDAAGNSVSLLRKEMRGMLINSSLIQKKTHCSCAKYTCGCCLGLKKIHLHKTVCVNITYLPAPTYDIALTMSFNDRVFYNKTIPARNPPEICLPVPVLKGLKLCLKFRNMSLTDKSLSGCLDLQATFLKLKKKFQLGCFKIPPGGVSSLTTFKVAETSLERGHLAGQGRKIKVKTYQQGQNVKDSPLYWMN